MSNPESTPENIAQTVAQLMANQADVTVLPPTDIARSLLQPLIVSVPDGRKVVDLTDSLHKAMLLLKPFARKGHATMQTADSLITWANRFKGSESMLFANNKPDQLALTCIADYHGKGQPMIDEDWGDESARHLQHRATYKFPLSKKWEAWMAISGKTKSGSDMGVFLEDNILDVIDPPLSLIKPGIAGAEATEADQRLIEIAQRLEGNYGTGAQLLGMAQSFTVNEKADYTVAQNSTTGEATIQIKSEHLDGAGQPIRVPKLFLIAIPVFENGPAYRIPVRFQYRKMGGTVAFILTLHDPKHSLDHAFTEALHHVQDATELPLLIGTPEA